MDTVLKNFLEAKKSLIQDTKIPALKRQDTKTPKTPKGMDTPVETNPYKRFADSVIKDLPTKSDLVDKIQSFIDSEEAKL